MSYLSDRQRTELMLLPMIAQSVVISGVNDPNHPDAVAAVNHFAEAMQEPVAGVDEKKRFNLMRRAIRLHHSITKPHREAQGRVDKVGLMLYYLLNWSVESGYLLLPEGTAMAKGLDLLLPALEHAANIAKLDASAKKAAIKLLGVLQSEGYFQGVTVQ